MKEHSKPIVEIKSLEDDFEATYEVVSERISKIDEKLSELKQEYSKTKEEREKYSSHADKFDYTLAALSGLLTGLLDIFFVGEFSLVEARDWGQEKVESFVKYVAKQRGWKGSKNADIGSAVDYLERNYKIAADQVTNQFGGGRQHHLRDFSHHCTPVGLFFSMLTQFTGKAYGTDKSGVFIIVDVPTQELIGKDIPSKFVLGFVHWCFHMVSDMVGSSGTIAKGKYGTGLPGPLISFLKELSALRFFRQKTEKGETVNPFSLFTAKLFNGTMFMERDENGKIIPESVVSLDLRTELGIAHFIGKQAIPVILNECIVRGAYFIRRFYLECKAKEVSNFSDLREKLNWKQILPFKNRTITRMLTIATGTFTAIDLADAGIRAALSSGGNLATFFSKFVLRINIVGVGRFVLALGDECFMEYKLHKVRKQQTDILFEMLEQHRAKLYYKRADLWTEVTKTEAAMQSLSTVVAQAVAFELPWMMEVDKRHHQIVALLEERKKETDDFIAEVSDF